MDLKRVRCLPDRSSNQLSQRTCWEIKFLIISQTWDSVSHWSDRCYNSSRTAESFQNKVYSGGISVTSYAYKICSLGVRTHTYHSGIDTYVWSTITHMYSACRNHFMPREGDMDRRQIAHFPPNTNPKSDLQWLTPKLVNNMSSGVPVPSLRHQFSN